MLSSTLVLIPFGRKRLTKVWADSSSCSLGIVLLQKSKEVWKPVAYSSCFLTETEKQYTQVEKEALAVVWAFTKFQDYFYGIYFILETDHKSLVPLLRHKTVDEIPPRIQRMRMWLMNFTYDVQHVADQDLHTADTLSHVPVCTSSTHGNLELEKYALCFLGEVLRALPISDTGLEEETQHQEEDHACRLNHIIHLGRVVWQRQSLWHSWYVLAASKSSHNRSWCHSLWWTFAKSLISLSNNPWLHPLQTPGDY